MGSLLIRILGWASVAVACVHAARMWTIDRRLQRYRAPESKRSQFALVPLRWRRDLYSGTGPAMVDQVWRAWRQVMAFGIVGAVLLALAR